MNTTDKAVRTKAEEALKGLEALHPLDLLAELVEKRISDRKASNRRWFIGIVVSVLVGFGAVIWQSFRQQDSFETFVAASRDSLQVRIESGIKTNASLATQDTVLSYLDSEPDSISVFRGTLPPQEVAVAVGATRHFRIENVDGQYQIDAVGVDGFDPYIELYRIDGTTLQRMGSDDDGGEGLNSRLRVLLQQGSAYELHVSEFFGNGGEVVVSVTRPSPVR